MNYTDFFQGVYKLKLRILVPLPWAKDFEFHDAVLELYCLSKLLSSCEIVPVHHDSRKVEVCGRIVAIIFSGI